jgi:hypothetical protein
MKTRLLVAATVAMLALAGWIGIASGQTSRATRDVMRSKLDHSQKALEGVTAGDFEILLSAAKKLKALGNAPDWPNFDNPEYQEHKANFRRSVSSLERAAVEVNLDSATLAYVRMTMNCVECHRFVRGKMVASR